jgi:hypothetical protein
MEYKAYAQNKVTKEIRSVGDDKYFHEFENIEPCAKEEIPTGEGWRIHVTSCYGQCSVACFEI